MLVTEMVNQCGLAIISDLSETGHVEWDDIRSDSDEFSEFQGVEDDENSIGRILRVLRAENYGAALASTNSFQRAAVKSLKEAGFTAFLSLVNPNSGRKITLWFKNLTVSEA